MRSKLKWLKGESGQSAVLFALALVVLCGFAAIVVDIGLATTDKGQLQNAADAAAMAAAQELPSSTAATNTAIQYAQLNGVEAGNTTVTTPYNGNSKRIEVVCKDTVKYTFARILGYTSQEVSARAVAEKSGLSGGAFGYAIFAGNQSSLLGMYTGNLSVNGSIHSNSAIMMNGSLQTVTGDVESVSSYSANGSSITIGGTCQGSSVTTYGSDINIGNILTSAASVVDMPDFSDTIQAEAEAAGTTYSGYTGFYSSSIDLDSSIYVDGDVNVAGGSFSGQGVVLATGNITFSSASVLSNSSSSVCFYSENGYIMINASNVEIDGVLYAPNNAVYINGSNVVINGRIIADKVYLNGSSIQIVTGSGDLDCLPAGYVKLVE